MHKSDGGCSPCADVAAGTSMTDRSLSAESNVFGTTDRLAILPTQVDAAGNVGRFIHREAD